MAANIEVADKLREAFAALEVARNLHDDALLLIGCPYTASGSGFRDLLEDLDIDIDRAEAGNLGSDDDD